MGVDRPNSVGVYITISRIPVIKGGRNSSLSNIKQLLTRSQTYAPNGKIYLCENPPFLIPGASVEAVPEPPPVPGAVVETTEAG